MKFYKKLLAGISFWVALRRLNEVLQNALGWNFVLDRIWAVRMGRVEAALGQPWSRRGAGEKQGMEASLLRLRSGRLFWATFGRLRARRTCCGGLSTLRESPPQHSFEHRSYGGDLWLQWVLAQSTWSFTRSSYLEFRF